MGISKFSKTSLSILKAQLHMARSFHIGLIDENDIEFGDTKTTLYAPGVNKFLTFFKSRKTIFFNSINFKDNFIQEKVIK